MRSRTRVLSKRLYGTILKILLISSAADIEWRDRIYLLFCFFLYSSTRTSSPSPGVSAWTLDEGIGEMLAGLEDLGGRSPWQLWVRGKVNEIPNSREDRRYLPRFLQVLMQPS